MASYLNDLYVRLIKNNKMTLYESDSDLTKLEDMLLKLYGYILSLTPELCVCKKDRLWSKGRKKIFMAK